MSKRYRNVRTRRSRPVAVEFKGHGLEDKVVNGIAERNPRRIERLISQREPRAVNQRTASLGEHLQARRERAARYHIGARSWPDGVGLTAECWKRLIDAVGAVSPACFKIS